MGQKIIKGFKKTIAETIKRIRTKMKSNIYDQFQLEDPIIEIKICKPTLMKELKTNNKSKE